MPWSRTPALSGLALLLSASTAFAAAAPAVPDSSRLWRVEAAATPPARPVFVCANARMHDGFSRPLPEINGRSCNVLEQPVDKNGVFTAWCDAGGARATSTSTTKGDLARDFTVVTGVSTRPSDQTMAGPISTFVQTRRYRLEGACPASWAIGDTAAQGDTALVNALTGVKTTLAKPFSPPAR